MGKKTLLENILQQLTISLMVVLVLSNTLPPWEYISIKPADEEVLTKGTVLKFDQPKVSKSMVKDYYTVSMPDTRLYLVPGAPIVPVKVYTFKLPYNCEVRNVKVEIETRPLKGQYKLLPGPKPVKLDSSKPERPKVEMFEEDPSIYESDKPYPEKMFEYEVKKGIDPPTRERVTYVIVRVFPVQYVPKKGSLTYASKVEIKVDYRDLSNQVEPLQQDFLVIITSTTLQTAAQTLASWKSSQGYTVWVRTVDWISLNYDGYDTPEKIRNFLKDAADNYGAWYVIILGDDDQVPARRVYSSEFEDLAENPWIESDLYYADLDGTWDTDNDHVYGEMQDVVDGYPDILVGRLPASTLSEANAIVNKLMNYNPDNSWFRRILLLGTVTFGNRLRPEGEILKDYWEANWLPDYFSWTKLYEGLGNLNSTNVKNEINDGYGIVNFAGHGNTRLWDFGEGGVFWDLDVYQLTNGFNTPIVATMACLTNDFADTDVAISEAFMIHPDGGAIAYLGVAEVAYGYGGYYVTEGLAGAIDWVFLALFKALEDEGYVPTPGLMHAYTIIVYLNAFGRSWVLDWYTVVEYGTLLGDPMLPLTGTGSPPPPPPTPRLYGCALDKDGHVVTNVLIRLYDYMSGNLLHEGIEADGCYEFVGLPYGTYMIEASKDDFYGGVAFYYPHVVMEKNVVLQEFPPNTVLLVVDDDGQGYVDEGVWPSEIESVLTSMGFNVFVWRESENGRPPLEVLQHENVEAVVWHTGTYFRWAVDPVDAQTLIQFVESGGRLLLEGEDIGWNHDRDEFMRRVAHAYQLIDDTNEETMVATAKHPVVYSLPTFSFETMPPYPDGVEPVNNGEEVARYQGTPYSAVVVYDGLYWGFGGRVVYVAFPLHYLYESYRNTLVENAVEWLTTSYVLKVSTDRGVYLPGYTVKAVASLFDGTNPLPGITVTASIYYPDGTVVSGLTMYDDGTHGDDVAGDGNYTLLYDILDTYPVGYYQIEAEADIPGYVPIYRNATFRVVAAPGFSLFVEDRDIVQGIISVNITVSNDAGLNIVMVQYRIDGSDWVDIPAPIDGAYDEDVETVHIEIDGYSHSLGWHFLDVRAFAEGGFESWWLGRPFEIRELSRRYNLISLIYYPEPGYSASSLARAIGPEATLIASWDTTAQKFKGYVPGVSPPSDDFPMEMGFGYFVYLTSPRRLVEFPGW